MSKNPKYIVKSQALLIGQDLEALKTAAIEVAKELSADVWSDYNEHDPGVTIIEQFCYAIMEMSYKANINFEQIFFAHNGNKNLNLTNYFLLKPEEVFYTSPVTPLDYRKLLIDYTEKEQKEITSFLRETMKNTWFLPSTKKGGNYLIYTHLDEEKIVQRVKQILKREFLDDNQKEILSEEGIRKKLDAQCQQAIYSIYHQHRNIGETCENCFLLKPKSIHQKFTLAEQAADYTQDKLVELITLFIIEIKKFVERPLQFKHSLASFNFEAETAESKELLQGTLPNQKFIDPVSLRLSSAEEVQKDLNLKLFSINNAHKWDKLIVFDIEENNNKYKRVNFDNTAKEILLFDEHAFLDTLKPFDTPSKNKLLRKEIKKALQVHFTKKNKPIERKHYTPQSSITQADLMDYHSIQYTFPANYNLGLDNLDSLKDLEKTEKNQLANQLTNLQGYLLLFESLLVDFLVKLVAFPELLKIEERGKDIFERLSSIFTKIIIGDEDTSKNNVPKHTKKGIPGAKQLLSNKEMVKAIEQKLRNKEMAKVIEQKLRDKEIAKAIEQKLRGLYNNNSFSIHQKINLRTYALARYGENFDKDLVKKAWGEPENFEADWLLRLGDLIQYYTEYGQNQHRSYTITAPYSDFPLSKKISILLNKVYDKKQPNVYIVEEHLIASRINAYQVYRVAIIIDLKEELEAENKEASKDPKRLIAIIKLVENELPLYLNSQFYFLTSEAPKKKIDNLFDEFTGNIQYLNSFSFKEEYWLFRENLADKANKKYASI